MNTLRTMLKESIPELHQALERSWQIALSEWLPAIPTSAGSHNAYPHLNSFETNLEMVVAAQEAHRTALAPRRRLPPLLTPVEVYVVLASILFHDYGKVRSDEKSQGATKKHQESHAEKSARTIVERHYALGITSEPLANVIARVCRCHDYDASVAEKEIDKLTTTSIDPWGEIRVRSCAAILRLLDHLDLTYTRALPEYVCPSRQIGPVGAFRRLVTDIDLDLEGQFVNVVLGAGFQGTSRDSFTLPPWCKVSVNSKRVRDSRSLIGEREGTKRVGASRRSIFRALFPQASKTPPLDLRRIARQLSLVNRRKDQPERPWPGPVLLSVLLGDCRVNAEALSCIADTLSALGLPLKKWLVTWEEHLYDEYGNETYEPVFSQEFLLRTANEMWRLSTGGAPHGEIPFETLAAVIHEQRLERVVRAVKRISIVATPPKGPPPIWYGNAGWKWSVRHENQRCVAATICDIEQALKSNQPCA